MKRSIARLSLLAVLAVLLALSLLMTGSAFAITGNWVDDNDHPFVGLVVIYDAKGEFIWRGSGSLISPSVVLTAGHMHRHGRGCGLGPRVLPAGCRREL